MRYMWSKVFVCLLTIGSTGLAYAQVQTVGENQMQLAPQKPPKEFVKEYRLTPAAEPVLALHYLFWDNSLRTNADNAVTHIYRATTELDEVPNRLQIQRDWDGNHGDAQKLPIKDFPTAAAKLFLSSHSAVLEELHLANLSQRIEHDLSLRERPGTMYFTTRFSELNQLRPLARLLALQARVAVVEGRYDDAVKSIQAGFRLGEIAPKLGAGGLIGKLVGLAIGQIMLDEVVVFIQQPDAPNLYWALASIPDDTGSLRSAMEVESASMDQAMQDIIDLPQEPVTAAAWQQRINAAIVTIRMLQSNSSAIQKDSPDTKLLSGLVLLTQGETAKAALIAQGWDPKAVEAMSYSEATIRVTRDELLKLKSDAYKWALLPDTDSDDHLQDALFSNSLQASPARLIFDRFVPAIGQARAAGIHFLTNRNQLINIEAIRAYAAAHQNRLPESLDHLEPLPAWKQIKGAHPFEYLRASDTQCILRHTKVLSYFPSSDVQLVLTPKASP